ncbi:hypothetical protein LCGC14_1830610 [marine sediment metagenome]|uniref:Uncharacterized protein n=1 Tax=marine sediment metagenome TaxID=412755 RepID=A0A0F9IVT4_9ZZZZ
MPLTHNEVSRKQRPWGFEVREVVWDGSTHIETFTVSWRNQFGIPTEQAITNRINQRLQKIQERLDFEAVRGIDVEEQYREAFFWIVRKVRENPDATLDQARNFWNINMSEQLFDFDKLVVYFRKLAGTNITWNQFKTYVINKKFEGVD